MTPQINSTNSNSDLNADVLATELAALQHTLLDAVAQMDGMAAALTDVVALFKAGALEGEQGDQWLAQVRDKVLPFVAETQSALRGAADEIDDGLSAAESD